MEITPGPFPMFNEIGLTKAEYVYAGRLHGRMLAIAHEALQTLPKGIRGLAVHAAAAQTVAHLEAFAPTCERPQDEAGQTIARDGIPPADWDNRRS